MGTDHHDATAWDPARAARRLWLRFEPIHAVTYFAPECDERYRALGLKGFWMGYFASRSAPFGRCSPELANATFFNFRPSMAERALPDAWTFASPEAVLTARLEGSVAALRRALGDRAEGPDLGEAADLAEAAANAARASNAASARGGPSSIRAASSTPSSSSRRSPGSSASRRPAAARPSIARRASH